MAAARKRNLGMQRGDDREGNAAADPVAGSRGKPIPVRAWRCLARLGLLLLLLAPAACGAIQPDTSGPRYGGGRAGGFQ